MDKRFRVNERIRISQIRVIAEDGEQLGVMTPTDALKLARERGYDLVEVAPMANPPVCRIMDFNKFKYEQDKHDREARRKHHVARLKEIKLRPHIEDHDYMVKINQLKRFLMRGDNVKLTMVFRGREMAHTDIGRKVLERVRVDSVGYGLTERTPILEGRFMTTVLIPDHASLRKIMKKPQTKSAERPAAAAPVPTAAQPSTATTGQGDGKTQNA